MDAITAPHVANAGSDKACQTFKDEGGASERQT